MCLVNDEIVSRGRPFGKRKEFEFNSYEVLQSGRVSYNMASACDHWLSQGCLVTCWSQDDDEYLVEACPECRDIRIYNSEDHVAKFAFENVRHSCICSGPDSTIFVWGHMKLLHLQLDGTIFRLLSTIRHLLQGDEEVSMAKEVASMCFAEERNTIVVLVNCNDDYDHYDIFGIVWPSVVVAWKHCGSVNSVPLDPEDVCYTPRGDVCVANTTNVLLLDPKDGSLIDVLFAEENLENISEVVSYEDDDEIRLAVRHGPEKPTKTSCFSLEYHNVKHDEFTVPIPDLHAED